MTDTQRRQRAILGRIVLDLLTLAYDPRLPAGEQQRARVEAARLSVVYARLGVVGR